jgi:hypothetical protein
MPFLLDPVGRSYTRALWRANDRACEAAQHFDLQRNIAIALRERFHRTLGLNRSASQRDKRERREKSP